MDVYKTGTTRASKTYTCLWTRLYSFPEMTQVHDKKQTGKHALTDGRVHDQIQYSRARGVRINIQSRILHLTRRFTQTSTKRASKPHPPPPDRQTQQRTHENERTGQRTDEAHTQMQNRMCETRKSKRSIEAGTNSPRKKPNHAQLTINHVCK